MAGGRVGGCSFEPRSNQLSLRKRWGKTVAYCSRGKVLLHFYVLDRVCTLHSRPRMLSSWRPCIGGAVRRTCRSHFPPPRGWRFRCRRLRQTIAAACQSPPDKNKRFFFFHVLKNAAVRESTLAEAQLPGTHKLNGSNWRRLSTLILQQNTILTHFK